ncbi:MAG TPA: hypothetical protein ENO23_01515, partial [Alphaproteobacteria bacterium]|nr:hypothetical protein [Alphaproteobacteria bacterium]
MATNLPQPYDSPGMPSSPMAHGYGGYEDEEEGTSLDPRRLFAAVLRHKWLVLALTVLGAAAGFVATRFMPDQYTAQATVWIEGGSGRGESGPIRSA